MADGEDHLAQLAAQNLSDYTPLFEFHKKLAEKYTKAAKKPWVSVEPDPPMP